MSGEERERDRGRLKVRSTEVQVFLDSSMEKEKNEDKMSPRFEA